MSQLHFTRHVEVKPVLSCMDLPWDEASSDKSSCSWQHNRTKIRPEVISPLISPLTASSSFFRSDVLVTVHLYDPL
jgi:hypothetical protein